MKMKPLRDRYGSFAILGIAALLIAGCTLALGSFLAKSGEARADTSYSGEMGEGPAVTDEAALPAGLTMKVDTRGIELPEGSVSAQYATAITADLAERVYGQVPTGRATAVLHNSLTTTTPSYDMIKGLYWDITMETDKGMLTVTVVAGTGVDYRSYFSPFSTDEWASWFDAWDDSVAGSSGYGTEAGMIEQQEATREQYGDEYGGPPITDDAQVSEARQRKIDGAKKFAASVADLPHGQRALEITRELDLGNGAQAISGQIITRGGGGPIDQLPMSTYISDVALDDGSYLLVELEKESMDLIAYTRNPVDWLTFVYGE